MNTAKKNAKPNHVVTGPNTIFSYLHVIEPSEPLRGGAPRYSASLIIPKKDTRTVEKIQAAIQAAYEEGRSRLKGSDGSIPALESVRNPLRDGDTDRPGDKAYENAWFLNASSVNKPKVVDADCNPILDLTEIYSGIIGRASVDFYAYSVNGNRGIACGLNHLQKLKDGVPLGGRRRPEDDFMDLDDEDEDYLD